MLHSSYGLAANDAVSIYPPRLPGERAARPPTTRHGGNLKRIPLTQGQVALVDDEDFERFGNLKWHASWNPKNFSFYVARNSSSPNRKLIWLSREIVGVTDQHVKVDHKNHNTLDNRRQNLRTCTHSQNLSNRNGLDSRNTSGVRGVSLVKKSGKWIAVIGVKGEKIALGTFIDIKEAALVYAAANQKYFGEFGGIQSNDRGTRARARAGICVAPGKTDPRCRRDILP